MVAPLLHLAAQLAGAALKLLLVHVGTQDDKLVAAGAEHPLLGEVLLQQAAALHDEVVPRLVAQQVVDLLEAGDIAVDHAHLGPGLAAGAGLGHGVAVAGPGELVVEAEEFQPLDQVPALEDGGDKVADDVEEGPQHGQGLPPRVVHP